jgi:hypothetical protein
LRLMSGKEIASHKETAIVREGDAAEPKMDPDTARAILEAIVGTHEKIFAETATPISLVRGYTNEQVREAMQLFADRLMNEHKAKENIAKSGRILSKNTPEGNLKLHLKANSLDLELHRYGKILLSNGFALKPVEPTGTVYQILTGFSDNRPGNMRTSLFDLGRKSTSPEFRQAFGHMVRGVRWMCANMLDWTNPNTIMPEQLDNLAFPPSRPQLPGK